jgi:hypothetical protein
MRDHVLNALFSLAFAVLILTAVGSHLTTTVEFTVPVEINVPRDVVVSHKGRLSTNSRLVLEEGVRVVLSGMQEKVNAIRQAGLRVVWSPTGAELEEALKTGRFEIRSSEVIAKTLPKRIEVAKADPPGIELGFSRVVEGTAYIKEGQILGSPAEGYRRGDVKLNVTQVRVRGDAKALDADPGTEQRPYLTEPIDLRQRPTENVVVMRKVVCRAQGVVALEEVEVTVEIEPELVELEIEFPIHFVEAAGVGEAVVEPLGFKVQADGRSWTRRLKLSGPLLALTKLKAEMERGHIGGQLPFAYIRASQLGVRTVTQPQRNKAKIRVTNLPPNVKLAEQDLGFRLTLLPVE